MDIPIDVALSPFQTEVLGIRSDPWKELTAWTDARIALGRSGHSLPTGAILDFQLCHAQARDAVAEPCDFAAIEAFLVSRGLSFVRGHSRAGDRAEYLRRPDLGRLLDESSEEAVRRAAPDGGCGLSLVIGDGLSSQAIERQAIPLLEALLDLLPASCLPLPPVVLARQSRVALADEVGSLLGARASIILIGERPGLTSPDSLGIYLTWEPCRGKQNADRNCISNVRPAGLSFGQAAREAVALLNGMFRERISGVNLKVDASLPDPAV